MAALAPTVGGVGAPANTAMSRQAKSHDRSGVTPASFAGVGGKPRTIKGRAKEVARRLAEEYPAQCALVHDNAFQLVVATILSAQCTDERVNMVTPEVFRRWPTPADLAKADPGEVESVIHPTGFFLNKTRSLIGLGQ